jgi:hypothetical protein
MSLTAFGLGIAGHERLLAEKYDWVFNPPSLSRLGIFDDRGLFLLANALLRWPGTKADDKM